MSPEESERTQAKYYLINEDNCELTTRCMIYLGQLKKLEVLNLSSNKIDFRVVVRFFKSLKLFEFSLWSKSRCEDKKIK